MQGAMRGMESDRVVGGGGYDRQCAIKGTCRDLGLVAETLAGGGVHPVSGERLLSREVTRQALSVMTTCGMYDAAGDWVTTVGFPAKSGVSGGVLGSLPGQVGIAVFSPRLDVHGHSVRGVEVFGRLSARSEEHTSELQSLMR